MANELRTQNNNSPLTVWDLFSRPLASFADFSPFDNMAEGDNFKTDIKENDKAYTLKADLPGVKKEDLKVDFNDGVLTISAEHHSSEEKTDKDGYILRERVSGSYQRSFGFDNVTPEGIDAAFDNGVLTITLPKAAAAQNARSIEIK